MERKALVGIVLVLVIIGGSMVFLLPSLIPQTEFRFAEGESGSIMIHTEMLENYTIDIEFIDDPLLKMKYTHSPSVGNINMESLSTTFRFSGVDSAANGHLHIILGSSAWYNFVIEGTAIDVNIDFNEFSHLLNDFRMDLSPAGGAGSSLSLTTVRNSTFEYGAHVYAHNIDDVSVDITQPGGRYCSALLASENLVVLLNDGWEQSSEPLGQYRFEKGAETLTPINFEIHADHIEAYLR